MAAEQKNGKRKNTCTRYLNISLFIAYAHCFGVIFFFLLLLLLFKGPIKFILLDMHGMLRAKGVLLAFGFAVRNSVDTYSMRPFSEIFSSNLKKLSSFSFNPSNGF